jgi:chemotaxis signal transduction protein
MDTGTILEGIERSQGVATTDSSQAQARTKYIVFSAGNGLYALLAEDVQEIMLGMDIHYLPFVPPFVRGLINRLGEPLTVLDLVNLLYGKDIEGKSFIILKPHLSKMAFLVDIVRDIAWIDPASIRRIAPESQGEESYVQGMFTWKDENVTILSLHEIIGAVRKACDAGG